MTHAPDHMAAGISIFKDYASAGESNRRGTRTVEQDLAPLARRTSHSRSRAGDRAHVGLAYRERAGDSASRERMAARVRPGAGLARPQG